MKQVKWTVRVLMLFGIGVLSLLLPIWDAPPFELPGGTANDAEVFPPENSELWQKVDALLESYEVIGYLDLSQWEAEPEMHREAIREWLEATGGLENELTALLDEYTFRYSPLTPGDGFEGNEATRVLEIARILNQRIRHQKDVKPALETYEILQRYAGEVQEADGYLIHGLVGLACAGIVSQGRIHLLHRYPAELTDSQLKRLSEPMIEARAFSPEYWVKTLDHEFEYFREMLPKKVTPKDFLMFEDVPAWMPRWNSFFYQPNRTLALQFAVNEHNKARITGVELVSEWASFEALGSYLEGRESGWFAGFHNYHGRWMVITFDLNPRRLRGLALNRMTQTLAALHRYRRVNGELPGALAELVPDFMSSVPVDPFDGKPIRYDVERGIVYSINENGVDNGGDSSGERTPERGLDFVIRIDGEG